MTEKQFEVGEVRMFEFQVTSKNKAAVIITSATWELKKRDTVVTRGDCNINKDYISMLVPMQTPGDFLLEIKAEIPPETIIERMHIRVVE